MIWLALLAATTDPASTPLMFGGPVASLQKLATAARQCGYKDAAVAKASFGDTVVSLPMMDAGVADHRFDCLMKWFLAHPKLELGFIGNKAAEPF
jgi:hypothetical protein